MANLPPVVLLALGLVTLLLGAEVLVHNASKLGRLLGISPLMIGLTVVALGTSAPELAVSLSSVFEENPDLALGNVVGSNILNILLILGLASLIRPVRVSEQLIRLDVPVMVGVSLAVLIMALDGDISRGDGGLLVVGALVYVWLLFRAATRDRMQELEMVELDPSRAPVTPEVGRTERFIARVAPRAETLPEWLLSVLRVGWIVLGVLVLVAGARMTVGAAVEIAEARGISPLIVGLTILATGTSLPELAASANASFRGDGDIAAGNVVGSNLLNLLVVLGLTALLAPGGISVPAPALAFDLPVMFAVAVACLPIFFTGYVISRLEGGLFLFFYAAYTTYLVLQGTRAEEPLQRLLETSLVGFVIPLTLVTAMIVLMRERRKARREQRRFHRDSAAG